MELEGDLASPPDSAGESKDGDEAGREAHSESVAVGVVAEGSDAGHDFIHFFTELMYP